MNEHLRRKDIYKLKKWSHRIKKLDNYKCKLCNTSKHLIVHHLYPKSIFPKKKFNLNNGITLCDHCHSDTHGWNRKTKAGLRASYPYEYNIKGRCLKRWRDISKKERVQRQREYNEKNQEKIKMQNKEWRKENKEYLKEYDKKKYIKIKNDPVLKRKKNDGERKNYKIRMENPEYREMYKLKQNIKSKKRHEKIMNDPVLREEKNRRQRIYRMNNKLKA